MLDYIILVVALVIPPVLYRYGKRWLGDQTHPAALFILAWMGTGLLLGSSAPVAGYYGKLALLWVSISFGAMALYDKHRQKPAPRTPDDPQT